MTSPSRTVTDPRPAHWVTHGDVAPDWSALPDPTIIALLARGCHDDPERPLVIVEDGLRMTRRDFLRRCEVFAGYLRGIVTPGDNVAVMLDNRLEFMVAFFAIVACRGTLVSVAPTAKSHDAGHILNDSRPVAIIHGPAQKPVVDEIAPGRGIAVIGLEAAEPEGLAHLDGPRLDFREATCQRDDCVSVYYTSGTTGAPKGCMLHHGWWLRVIDIDLRLFRRGWQDRQLCVLPFYYADPTIQLLTSVATRGTMIAMRRFSVSRFWEVVTQHDATELLSIASIPALLMTGEPGPQDRDHRMRLAIHAGLPKDIHRTLIDRYGFHWHNQYGSTEGGVMSRVPDALADDLVGLGTMGVEPPGVTVRVADDDGNEVPVGQTGEALIAGADLYMGYLNRPEVTDEANRGGWYHSGDMVRRDERGLLYFVGRRKEIIRRSGENISASEVEAVLGAHPLITEAAVVPVPDAMRGEEVKAYLLVAAGVTMETLPPEAVLDHCRERLAGFKVPRYLEYRTTDFPRLASMKVDKQTLKSLKPDLRDGAWDREGQA
ncbi:MAG: class I adenylate-forming enzyme family protein [Gemmobacter sp.]